MPSPLIGITTYGEDEEGQLRLPRAYVDALRRAGGTPVLIPPGETAPEALLAEFDGVVFAGGGDIDPARYGGCACETIYNVDAERDHSELALARAAVAGRIPVLGICRGIQVINVVMGGTLIEHLPDVVGEKVLHRSPPREPAEHSVTVESGSRLAGLLKQKEFVAASWHHQAIRRLAPGLTAVAFAPDGTIEAAESAAHPWLIGVQWHPELTAGKDAVQQRLFDRFVEACVKSKAEVS